MTKYTLYIPRHVFSVDVEKETRRLTALFGGCTRHEGQGEWINDAGMPLVEATYIFTVLNPQGWNDLQYQVRVIERSISDLTGEDCILSTHESSNMSFTMKLKRA